MVAATSSKIGLFGLGRTGGNMAARFLAGGTRCTAKRGADPAACAAHRGRRPTLLRTWSVDRF